MDKSEAHCTSLGQVQTHPKLLSLCTSTPWDHNTHLAKLARFWVTLAMSVRVRAVRSSGYSCSRLKSEGDMMAGHRKRKKREALMSRSLISGRPRLLHSCRHEANTSLSSRGKTLSRKRQRRVWDQVGVKDRTAEVLLSHETPSSNPISMLMVV